MIALMFVSVSCGLSGSCVVEPVDLPAPVEVRLDAQPWFVPQAYIEMVVNAAYANDIPVWLLARLFKFESRWDRYFIGSVNDNGTIDLGIAGLNSACLVDFEIYNDGKKIDPFDPETAIRVGIRRFAALHKETGTWREAIRRYAGRRPENHVKTILGELN